MKMLQYLRNFGFASAPFRHPRQCTANLLTLGQVKKITKPLDPVYTIQPVATGCVV